MDEDKKGFLWGLAKMQALPAAVFSIYVCGFLATNLHLGKFGIFDFDLLSYRYVVVGILYFIFVGFWLFFVGRFLWHTVWYSYEIGEENSILSSVLARIHWLFLICVSTALFTLIFHERAEAVYFCALAAVLRIVGPWWENLWESRGLSMRFPLGDAVIEPAVSVLAIVLFFVTMGVDVLGMIVFFHFLAMSIYGRFILQWAKQYKRRKESRDNENDLARGVVHVVVLIVLSSTSFGWLQYGNIGPHLGGGQSQSVEILVVDPRTVESLQAMGLPAKPIFKAELIHEDEERVFVGVGARTVQLSREAIAGVRVFSAGPFGWGAYANRIWSRVLRKWEEIHNNPIPASLRSES